MKTEVGNFLKSLAPHQLFDEENFKQIKYQADLLIESFEYDGAAEYSRDLEGLLKQIQPEEENTDYYNILLYWMYRLRLFAFSVLKPKEKDEIFKDDIIIILSLGLDIKDSLNDSVAFYDSVSVIESLTKSYATSLAASNVLLGENNIKQKNIEFKPTISNWIGEYSASIKSHGAQLNDSGTFHILNFFNTNQYAKELTEKEKALLKEVLDLYDWLIRPVAVEGGGSQIIDYNKNSYNIVKTDLITQGSLLTSSRNLSDIKSPNVQALKPQSILPKKDNLDLGSSKSPGIKLFSENPPEAAKLPNVHPKPAGQLSDNLVKDLNSIQKEIALKKSLAQAEIQKKLTKLKDRKK